MNEDLEYKTDLRKIEELQLLNLNPRYTDFKKINWNDLYKCGNLKNQDEIARELLFYEEENHKDFITLLESIYKNGYDNRQDRIILMQTQNNSFLVLEGNRKILASKMIIDIEWSKKILNNEENSKLYKTLLQINKDKDFFVKREILLKKKIENITYCDNFEDEKNIDLMNKSIFGRSMSFPIGKRIWPRFQTLTNTWDFYTKHFLELSRFENNKNKLIEKSLHATADSLFKSISSTKAEVKSAKIVLTFVKNYNQKNLINWKKERVSAIELSLNQINISKIVDSKNFAMFYDIDVGFEPELEFKKIDTKGKDKEIFMQEFSNFIIDSYFEKFYSTRGWKENKLNILREFIKNNS